MAVFPTTDSMILMRTPACGLSIMLVVARHRSTGWQLEPVDREMKHSSNPSSKLAAAAGHSRSNSNHSDSLRIFAMLSLCPKRRAAFISDLTWQAIQHGYGAYVA